MTIIYFKVYPTLHFTEIHPQRIRANIFVDNLKSVINRIMNLPKNFLHVGSEGSIVIDIEKEVIEITKELKEDIKELSVARNINGLVDG